MGYLERIHSFRGDRSVVAGACNIRWEMSFVLQNVLQGNHIRFLAFMQRHICGLIFCVVPQNENQRLCEGILWLHWNWLRLRLRLCLVVKRKVDRVSRKPIADPEEVLGNNSLAVKSEELTPAVLDDEGFLALIEREVNGRDRMTAGIASVEIQIGIFYRRHISPFVSVEVKPNHYGLASGLNYRSNCVDVFYRQTHIISDFEYRADILLVLRNLGAVHLAIVHILRRHKLFKRHAFSRDVESVHASYAARRFV